MNIPRRATHVIPVLIVLAACDVGGGAAGPADVGPDEPTTVTTPMSDATHDGELAFQEAGAIWTQKAGEERRNAAPSVSTDNEHPAWSPDGEQIAFEGNFNTVWTVGADGTGEQEQFTCEAPCAAVYEPAWSPDGARLAFIRIVGDGTYTVSAQLVTLDLETGDLAVLQEDDAGDVWEYTPRWSGDGTRLVLERDVFASNRLDESQVLTRDLRIVDAATGEATTVRGTRGAEFPDWNPTADLIVFTRGGNLFTIRPDGTHRKRLTHFAPKRQSAIQPTFTPDGESVVFTWVRGVVGSGSETTRPGVVSLESGDVTAIQEAVGATHVRLRP